MVQSLISKTFDHSATLRAKDEATKTTKTITLTRDASVDTVASESELSFISTSDDSESVADLQENLELYSTPQIRSAGGTLVSSPCSVLKQSSSKEDAKFIRRQGPWRALPQPDVEIVSKQSNCSRKRRSRKDRTVMFDFVILRLYDQTLGDNPSAPFGPPIQLDWKYEEQAPIGVDDFERRIRKWVHPLEMQLSCAKRRRILSRYYGFTKYELHDAEQEVKKIKRQRFRSMLRIPLDAVQDFASGLVGRAKRLVQRKSSSKY